MHGATIYSDVLGASRVCMDKSFFNNVRPNFGQLSFPFVFYFSYKNANLCHFMVLQACSGHFVFIDTEHA